MPEQVNNLQPFYDSQCGFWVLPGQVPVELPEGGRPQRYQRSIQMREVQTKLKGKNQDWAEQTPKHTSLSLEKIHFSLYEKD